MPALLGPRDSLLYELTQPRGLSIALGTLAMVLVVAHVGLQLARVRRLQRVEKLRALQRPTPERGLPVAGRLETRLQQLERQRAQQEAMWRALPVAYLVLDGDGKIRQVNDEAVRLFGQLESELAGSRIDDVCVSVEGGHRALRDGSLVRVQSASGEERELELHRRVVRGDDGQAIAELWTALEARPGAVPASQNERDVELAAMARLAGTLARDFNNHLTAILGHTCLLQDELQTAGIDSAAVAEIKAATESATSLGQRMMTFGRKGPSRPEAVDVAKLLTGEGTDLLRAALDEISADIELTVVAKPEVGYVQADPGHLREALRHLAVNAAEAMRTAGGRLRVEATRLALPPTEAFGPDETDPHPGPWVRIRVDDSGRGMSDSTLERAFEPYFTTKGPHVGKGLGLPIVYGLVTQNGGRVAASSDPEHGTVVDLYFPSFATVVRADPVTAEGVGRGQSVLVVEDDEPVRMTVQRMLEAEGYEVLVAEAVDVALDVCASRDVDLVLTDVRLPGRTGVELRDELARSHPAVRVVFMSGFVDDSSLLDAIGDAAFLQKPFTPSELLDKVREASRPESSPLEYKMRVLIVDDEEMIRNVVSMLLASLDFECHVATDGDEAMRELAKRDYDVVLCDMVMPKKDGIELCREIRERFPKVGVVAMSGNVAGSASLQAAEVLGASATLNKPFSRDELLLALGSATPS